MTWAGRTALRVVRWSLITAVLIGLIVADAAFGYWSNSTLGSKGFFAVLVWAFVLLVLLGLLGLTAWWLCRRPRKSGVLLRDVFEIGFKQPRRDVTIAVAILILFLGSILQYLAVGHAG